MDTELTIIGRMHTPFATGKECPRHGDESTAEGIAEIFAPFVPALHSIEQEQEVTLLTWLDKADRTVLSTHPRGDTSRPMRGVFNSRAPARPNPIGLHDVRILEIPPQEPDGSVRLRVAFVDMMDGTSLLDIKSTFAQRAGFIPGSAPPERSVAPGEGNPVGLLLPQIEAISTACRNGWQRGLLSGFNGNVSMRSGTSCIITRSGCVKACLDWADFGVLDIDTGKQIAGSPASSEAQMHCAIYRRLPKADAVVHAHPPHLLALSLLRHPMFEPRENGLFEASAMLGQLGWVKDFPPGSSELAEAVAEMAVSFPAVWMHRHGITCCSSEPQRALSLAEELDHLAKIELLLG